MHVPHTHTCTTRTIRAHIHVHTPRMHTHAHTTHRHAPPVPYVHTFMCTLTHMHTPHATRYIHAYTTHTHTRDIQGFQGECIKPDPHAGFSPSCPKSLSADGGCEDQTEGVAGRRERKGKVETTLRRRKQARGKAGATQCTPTPAQAPESRAEGPGKACWAPP